MSVSSSTNAPPPAAASTPAATGAIENKNSGPAPESQKGSGSAPQPSEVPRSSTLPSETKVAPAPPTTTQNAAEGPKKTEGSKDPLKDLIGHVTTVLSPTKLFGMAKEALMPVATGVVSDLISGGVPILKDIASKGIEFVAGKLGDLLFCEKFFNDPDVAMAIAEYLKELCSTDEPVQFKHIYNRLEFYRLMLMKVPDYQVSGLDRVNFYDERNVFSCCHPYLGAWMWVSVGGVAQWQQTPATYDSGLRVTHAAPGSLDARFDWAPWIKKMVVDYKMVTDPAPLILYARGGIDVFDLQVVLRIIAATAGLEDGFKFGTASQLTKLLQMMCMWYVIPGNDMGMVLDRYTNCAASAANDLVSPGLSSYFPWHYALGNLATTQVTLVAVDMVLHTDILTGSYSLDAGTQGIFTRASFGATVAVVPVNREMLTDPVALSIWILSFLPGPVYYPRYSFVPTGDNGAALHGANMNDFASRLAHIALPGTAAYNATAFPAGAVNGQANQFLIYLVVVDFAVRSGTNDIAPLTIGAPGQPNVQVTVHTRLNPPNIAALDYHDPVFSTVTQQVLNCITYASRMNAIKVLKDWHRFVGCQQDFMDAMNICAAGLVGLPVVVGKSSNNGDATPSLNLPYESTQAPIVGDAYVTRPPGYTNSDYQQIADSVAYTNGAAFSLPHFGMVYSGFGTLFENINLGAVNPAGVTVQVIQSTSELLPYVYANYVNAKTPLEKKMAFSDPPMLLKRMYELGKRMHYVYHAFARMQRVSLLEWLPPPAADFPNLNVNVIQAKHRTLVTSRLGHIWRVITLGSLRPNLEMNVFNVNVMQNWNESLTGAQPAFPYQYVDMSSLPYCLYETKMDRKKDSLNVTTIKGAKNYSYGQLYPNVNTRFMDVDRKCVDYDFSEYFMLTDQAFYKGTNDPARRVFYVKIPMTDVRRDYARKFMPYGWMKRLWILQNAENLVTFVRPNYTYMEVFLCSIAASYSDGETPLRVLYNLDYTNLNGYLAVETMQQGLRQMFGSRGFAKINYTDGLKATEVDPDEDRGTSGKKEE